MKKNILMVLVAIIAAFIGAIVAIATFIQKRKDCLKRRKARKNLDIVSEDEVFLNETNEPIDDACKENFCEDCDVVCESKEGFNESENGA